MAILALIVAIITIVITIVWLRFYWKTSRVLAKVPHLNGHFLLGDLEKFTGKLFVNQTTPFYQRFFNAMNEICSDQARDLHLLAVWLAFVPFVLLTSSKSVEQLLTSSKLIEKSTDYEFLKPWLSTGLLTSGSNKWRSRRKFLTPSFHFRILNDFIPIINKHSRIMISKIKQQLDKPLDIVGYCQMEALDVICETAMGVSIEAQAGPGEKYADAVISVSDAILRRSFEIQNWVDFIYYRSQSGRQFKKNVAYLHNFTDEVIKSRKTTMLEELKRANPETEKEEQDSMFFGKKKKAIAFMDLLIKRHLEGLRPDGTSDFSLEDIREEVDTFMFEGFDTTSAALTFTLHLLGHNPEIQDKAYEEIRAVFGDDNERPVTDSDLHSLKYVELCIKETLRLYPSVPYFARKVTEDVEICGYIIPKNVTLAIYTYALHRDPNTFPDPEKYIPERFLPENCVSRHPFAYIPFSAGPRNCIGQKFAMMELKIAVTDVLRNFKVQSINKNISISIDVVTKAKEAVLVKFIPRL